MKITVFNGSPKKEKSDTMIITKAFLEGMNETAKQDIDIINVPDMNIGFCKGCFACKFKGGSCCQNDDMETILTKISESDLLIFSFPLHSYGMPAPLKNLIDRMLPLSSMAMRLVNSRYEHVSQRDFSQLKYLMICGCGFPNSKHNFEPAKEQFELLFPNNHTIITLPESQMFNAPEAASVTLPRLALIKEAGAEYAEHFTISESLMNQIISPMIPEYIYAKIVNGED